MSITNPRIEVLDSGVLLRATFEHGEHAQAYELRVPGGTDLQTVRRSVAEAHAAFVARAQAATIGQAWLERQVTQDGLTATIEAVAVDDKRLAVKVRFPWGELRPFYFSDPVALAEVSSLIKARLSKRRQAESLRAQLEATDLNAEV